MNVREAINFGLNKLNFENIRENQSKVVEAYLSGRDLCFDDFADRICPFSLTFHIILPFISRRLRKRRYLDSVPRNFSSGFVNE